MRMIPTLAALMLVAATLSTPASAQTVPVQIPASDLSGATWMWLRSEYADGSSTIAADPTRYTVQFHTDGTLAIGADCNRATGTYTQADGQLSIQLGATTLAACPEDSQADTFLADLSNTGAYAMSGGNLVLNLRAGGGRMLLQPQAGALSTGVPWRILSYNNGRQAVVSVSLVGIEPGSEPSATFSDDGSVTGSTGCNTFRGTYTSSGSQLSVGPLATTRRACVSDAASAQEQAILAAFEATAMFELRGDGMTLRSADGATQLMLVRPLDGAF